MERGLISPTFESDVNLESPKFGVGLRSQHYQCVVDNRPRSIDAFEIISENFMGVGGRPFSFLEQVRRDYPVIMHGVGLSIGSPGPVDLQYLAQLRQLTSKLQPLLVSDHLCWTTYGRHNSHDLLPIAYTEESLKIVSEKIQIVQDQLGRRLYLENPSAYVAFSAADYGEAEFLCELVKRTGMGVQLDLNNLYVNHRNLGLDPIDYLERLKPESVGYMHLAGHSSNGNVLIDTHDHPVPDPVWQLYRFACKKFHHAHVIVEWDDHIPEFGVLEAECTKARQYWDCATIDVPNLRSNRQTTGTERQDQTSLKDLYQSFFGGVIRVEGPTARAVELLNSSLPVSPDEGLNVYNNAYFLRLKDCLADTHRSLYHVCQEQGFRHLLVAYLEAYPPAHADINKLSHALPEFLKSSSTKISWDYGVPLSALGDLAAYEAAHLAAFTAADVEKILQPDDILRIPEQQWPSLRFKFVPCLRLLSLDFDVVPAVHAIRDGNPPSKPKLLANYWMIYRDYDGDSQEEAIDAREYHFLRSIASGQSFGEACELLSACSGEHEAIESAAHWLFRLVHLGLIADASTA
jgi:uncharacterized protein (UPF0276 family)